MTTGRWNLPKSWKWAKANEIAQIVGGGTPSTKDEANFLPPGEGFPWIGPADLTKFDEVYISDGRRDLSAKGLKESGATTLPSGTVLFTSRAPIGYCVIAKNPISTNQGFKSLACDNGITPEFIRYYLKFSVSYIDSFASGTTFREISGKKMAEILVPLPPLAEQRRIVAKLDSLTARIARARAELECAKKLTNKIYTSVEKSYFNTGNMVHWKVVPLESILTEGLTGLVRSKNDQCSKGVPYIRMNHFDLNGLWNSISLTYVNVTSEELDRYEIKENDILFNTRNSTELVGKVAIWPQKRKGFVYNNNLLRLRFIENISPHFIFHYMMSSFFRSLLEEKKSATTSVAAIYQKALYKLPVPLPCEQEQGNISKKLNISSISVNILKKEIEKTTELLDRLESSLLAKAFRGELVPQDSNDEPASALLDRIRAERAEKLTTRKRK